MPAIIEHWVEMLHNAPLPVLARTVSEIRRFREDEERISTQSIANVVLHDPFMTVKVLQYLKTHRARRQDTDITTIAHALMMLGLRKFFEHFSEDPLIIEEKFAVDDPARIGMMKVMSRARHAALYAHDWARLRHDFDPEEVMIAAMLHDLSEMLLWYYAPELALEIVARQQEDHALRSDKVQKDVIGFRLIDLQLEIVRAWELPELLHKLMDENHIHNLRVLNVSYACALARHSAHGWGDLALPHDYMMIARLLGFTLREAQQCVIYVATHATQEWEWYGVPSEVPPPLPEPEPEPITQEVEDPDATTPAFPRDRTNNAG